MSPHYRHTQVGWVILGVVAAILAFVWSRLPPEAAAAARFPLLLVTALTRARLQRPDRRGGCRGDPPALRDRPRSQADPARRSEGLAGRPQPLVHRVGDPPGAGLRAVERVGTGRGGARSRQRPALPRRDGRAGRRSRRPSRGRRARPRRGRRRASTGRPRARAASSAGRRSPSCSSRSWSAWWARIFWFQVQPPSVTVRPDGLEVESPFYGKVFPASDITGISLDAGPPPCPGPDQRLCRRGLAAGPLPGRGAGRRAPLRRGGLRAVRPGAPAARASSSSTSASRRRRGRSTTRWPARGPSAWPRRAP